MNDKRASSVKSLYYFRICLACNKVCCYPWNYIKYITNNSMSKLVLIILTLLETAVAFIQALIFTILIAVYIQEMIHVG